MSAESLANVSQLLARKTDAETRDSFRALYGEDELTKLGAKLLLTGFASIGDHIINIAVIQQLNPGVRMVRVHDTEHIVHHSPSGLLVASTDGQTITEHHTVKAHGKYIGSLDAPYDARHEQLDIEFLYRQSGEPASLSLNVGTREGSLTRGGLIIGQVMSELLVPDTVAS